MSFETCATVAFIDDDAQLRDANAQALGLAGLQVLTFEAAAAALEAIDSDFPGVVVTDIRMPRMDGYEVFRRLHDIDPDLPVIFITGHGDVDSAVQALQDGAYDFVAKPYAMERLLKSVRRGLEKRSLVLDNRRLRLLSQRADVETGLLGDTPVMERLRATIRQIADADLDVLIEGETGVGKEVVARALHRGSRRHGRPMTVINCAALPDALVESELFGHEAGAFPGAVRKRVGRIEAADRGTLFLDEVESIPTGVQGKLLRVLEEREVTPLGGNEVHGVDIRVIAAAKRDLNEAVHAGVFRADLFYRLNVIRLRVPPLRERRADIALLFGHFLEAASQRLRKERPPLTEAIRRHLIDHDWPGNVRELEHFADRVALGLVEDQRARETKDSLRERVDAYEAQVLSDVLSDVRGDVRAALAVLQLPRKTFYDKIQRHGLTIDAYRVRGGA